MLDSTSEFHILFNFTFTLILILIFQLASSSQTSILGYKALFLNIIL